MPQCPHQALQIVNGKVVWNAVVCEQCDTCLKMCPQHATPMAQSMSVDEVLSHIRKAVLFIEGITVSGGEATTQLPFVVALFTAIKNDPQLCHLTCLVDSNGMLSEPAGKNYSRCATAQCSISKRGGANVISN